MGFDVSVWGVLVNAMGYVYHFLMLFLTPLLSPIGKLFTFTINYYNPFFGYDMWTPTLGSFPFLGDTLESMWELIINTNFFNLVLGINSDTPTWVCLLFLVAVFGVAIFIIRVVTNFIN